jgi:cytidylate kinase
MSEKTVITIGREYGSGGHEIGVKLAEELGIKCYDKELLELASKESGLCQEIFEHHDEKPTNSFLYSLVMDTYSLGYSGGTTYVDMPINHKVFLAQFDTIKKLADEGPCVIIGRCADYALEDNANAVSVFIKAAMPARTQRIMRLRGLTESKAADLIYKNDKRRASYYNYYSNKKWGEAKSYDLCLDSSKIGIDGCIDVIKRFIEVRDKARMNDSLI